MTPTRRASPASIWRATSSTTSDWFSGFLLLLAWLASTMMRCARPALDTSWHAASTLAAS
ncbi:hypothetical protein D3C72_2541510 [compost metagenome]